jgi:hypothetical protein
MLSAFLTNDALLWGCIGMALIALVSVGRVASRRRRAGKTSRRVRAEADAVHEFLDILRAEHRTAPHGIWHYDFTTGAQQHSDGFNALLGAREGETIEDRLKASGVDLISIARGHFEETLPFEVRFTLEASGGAAKAMVLRACNMRNANGEVQRLVAMLTEAGETAAD